MKFKLINISLKNDFQAIHIYGNLLLTTCEFFAPKLALCTINFLSPNCMPFSPAHPYLNKKKRYIC